MAQNTTLEDDAAARHAAASHAAARHAATSYIFYII